MLHIISFVHLLDWPYHKKDEKKQLLDMCFNDLLTPLDRSKRSALRPLNLSRIMLSRTCQGFRIRWTASSSSSTNQWWRNTHWRWSYSPWMNAWRPPPKWWTGKDNYHKENLKTEFLKIIFLSKHFCSCEKVYLDVNVWWYEYSATT